MRRARLLYVPIAAALEADQFAARVDWADIATFDVPGAGTRRGEPPEGPAGAIRAALERLDELGWERSALVADSHGQAAAIELAVSHADRVDAIFIGHAAARYTHSGDRPAMTPAIHDAALQLLDTDYRSFARAVTQLTQGLTDDETVDAWTSAVPQPTARRVLKGLADGEPDLAVRLRDVDLPVVLGQHRGCVMWTEEGFADAVAAVPHARAIVCDGIPTHDPTFLAAMCEIVSRG